MYPPVVTLSRYRGEKIYPTRKIDIVRCYCYYCPKIGLCEIANGGNDCWIFDGHPFWVSTPPGDHESRARVVCSMIRRWRGTIPGSRIETGEVIATPFADRIETSPSRRDSRRDKRNDCGDWSQTMSHVIYVLVDIFKVSSTRYTMLHIGRVGIKN